MLRISITQSAENASTLRLEGQLAGPWTEELEHACAELLSTGRKLALDLGELSLIDRPGVALLSALGRDGVVFVRCSPFQEEQLRQAAATDPGSISTRP